MVPGVPGYKATSLEPRPSSPRFYLAAVEKNRLRDKIWARKAWVQGYKATALYVDNVVLEMGNSNHIRAGLQAVSIYNVIMIGCGHIFGSVNGGLLTGMLLKWK